MDLTGWGCGGLPGRSVARTCSTRIAAATGVAHKVHVHSETVDVLLSSICTPAVRCLSGFRVTRLTVLQLRKEAVQRATSFRSWTQGQVAAAFKSTLVNRNQTKRCWSCRNGIAESTRLQTSVTPHPSSKTANNVPTASSQLWHPCWHTIHAYCH